MVNPVITMETEQLEQLLILCSNNSKKYLLFLSKIANKRMGGGSGSDHSGSSGESSQGSAD